MRFFTIWHTLLAVAGSDAFSFDAHVRGWHFVANSSDLVLSSTQSGAVWRSPLLSVRVGTRTSVNNVGCWSHKIYNVSKGGQWTLDTGKANENGVQIEGLIAMPWGQEKWLMEMEPLDSSMVKFNISVDTQRFSGLGITSPPRTEGTKEVYRYESIELSLRWLITESEIIVGAGEQFSTVDLSGRRFHLWAGEQGIGRGLEPLSRSLDLVAWPCAGNAFTTYSHVPALLSSAGYGLVLENSQLITVDLTSSVAAMTVSFGLLGDLAGVKISGHLLGGPSVRSMLPTLTSLTGRMPLPPSWMLEGLIVGSEGGHQVVNKQVSALLAAKVPVTGVWIQDWSGVLLDRNGKFAWWNWELDEERYPKQWFRDLAERGIKVLTYINPRLTNAESHNGKPASIFAEAKRLGHLITDTRGNALIRKVNFASFEYGMVNLFKEESWQWWSNLIRCNVMMACDGGPPLVHAWMHDYGEDYPLDASVSSMEDGATSLHNKYPRRSAKAARAAVNGFPEVTFFTRSGDLHSPGTSQMFWLGDQLTSWDGCDGLQSAMVGAMSGGLSGWSMNHVDVGGFTMTDRLPWLPMPGIRFRRNDDLLTRWMELSVFLNVVLRTHMGLLPNISAQVWDTGQLDTTRHLTELFGSLRPYRESLLTEAVLTGLPPIRHGILVHPEDRTWFNNTLRPVEKGCSAGHSIGLHQFFFGDDVIVAPVLRPLQEQVSVYLPKGAWVHLWSNKQTQGPVYTSWDAPPGRPAMFYLQSSAWASFFFNLSRRFVPRPEALDVGFV
mmetsp:Transcript_69531/g.137565  ORF Transcript_69531/g.137565 Transcript_69531/m.137565 type:complete len:777 (+) Transcript_69531:46-2376(+)